MSEARLQIEALNTALSEFVEVLNKETAALAHGNAEDLGAQAAHKQELAQNVGVQWQLLLKSLGLAPENAMSALRGSGLPTETIDKMEHLGKEAERLNQLNGKMLEEQLRRTQAAMNILQRASATHTLYGADGLMVGSGKRNRSIDRA